MKVWLVWQVTTEQIHSFEGEEIRILIDIFKKKNKAEKVKEDLEKETKKEGQDYYYEIEERKVI